MKNLKIDEFVYSLLEEGDIEILKDVFYPANEPYREIIAYDEYGRDEFLLLSDLCLVGLHIDPVIADGEPYYLMTDLGWDVIGLYFEAKAEEFHSRKES